MISRRSVVFSFIVFVFVGYGYIAEFANINRTATERGFRFSIPKVPTISVHIKPSKSVSDFDVWGVKQQGINLNGEGGSKALSVIAKKGYMLRKIGGVFAICSVVDSKYRWEFYGTAYEGKKMLAVFYNPALKRKREKVLAAGERLDRDLLVRSVENDNVIVECCNGGKVFHLTLFGVDKKFLGRKKK